MVTDTLHSLGLMAAAPVQPKTLAGTLTGRGGKFGLAQSLIDAQTRRKF
jgi:hypothetical protein